MARGKGKIEKHTVEKRRKRKREKISVVETEAALNIEGKHYFFLFGLCRVIT